MKDMLILRSFPLLAGTFFCFSFGASSCSPNMLCKEEDIVSMVSSGDVNV